MLLTLACTEPLKAPTLKPEVISTTRIAPSGAEIDVTVDADNPNAAALTTRSIETKVNIGGRPDIAQVQLGSPLTLAARAHTKVKLSIRVVWRDPAAIATLAATKQTATFVVDGTVELSDGKNSIHAPFQVNGGMSAADLAQAAGVAAPPAIDAGK